jgi:molecular chaperone HtpG
VLDNKTATISIEAMPTDEFPVIITLPEFFRRMKDMSALSGERGMFGAMPDSYNIAVNANHPLADRILKLSGDDEQKILVKQSLDLAKLAQGMLSGSDLTAFIRRTVETL